MAFYMIGFGLAAVGSYSANAAANASADAAQDNANRRYALNASVAENQMEEQKSLAMEKMTEVTRGFLITRGTMDAVQAETMVGGNVQKRLKAQNRLDASEAKGQVAKTTNRNIQNIAQDMLAEKVDTEALLMEAESRKKSSLAMLVEAGGAGLSAYASLGGTYGTTATTSPIDNYVFTNSSGIKDLV